MNKSSRFALLFSAVVMFGSCVPAQPAYAQTAQQMQYCELFVSVAEKTVHQRYEGVPMQELLDYANGTDVYRDIVPMIREAYSLPKVNGRQARAGQAFEFGTRMYVKCVNMMVRL
ncbi:hypothetical protein [Stenotrophomonas phage BUCT627]|uniref:Uncharacterized protein n=2 Tax=Bixiavirus TaxID=3044676 RepID=A0AC61N9W9_9CAUD|nr:hypothetical protein PQD76_gp55 [Stenotrophomonas phage BUCT626]YP_010677445.1 hypothetical protein PQD77_gp039 [Stenotrophomonas phage BUCT627]QYC96645.1 hypothetical protein [Stenotrophomonas phage BUCT627]QYC96759.1 hypothetical protein [Stenotrophomonas phage BUCT626]